ncbi:MAG: hypothetical protein WEA10_05830 [Actinomycetota bacterium]
MPWWVTVPLALVVAVLIWRVGIGVIRGISVGPPAREKQDAEDVEELDVFLVCSDCGTEFQVTRIGELQIPRHCGERMQVVRRPRGAAPAS